MVALTNSSYAFNLLIQEADLKYIYRSPVRVTVCPLPYRDRIRHLLDGRVRLFDYAAIYAIP